MKDLVVTILKICTPEDKIVWSFTLQVKNAIFYKDLFYTELNFCIEFSFFVVLRRDNRAQCTVTKTATRPWMGLSRLF